MRLCAGVLLIVALLASCQYPRDPDGTLNRVEGGVMRVGVSESDPWVVLEGDEPSGGAEIELVRRFARELGARIEWVHGPEEPLVEATKEGQVDLIVAGLTAQSRWKKDVAFTRPYLDTRTVVAVPPGSSLPDDFAGVPVAAELGSTEEGLLAQRTDARVQPVDRLEPGKPTAAPSYLIDDLGLVDSGTELAKDRHVMAVKLGENAFLVRLERFLLGPRSRDPAAAAKGGEPVSREGGARDFELPERLRDCQRRAVRLERVTLIYLVSAIALLFLTLGQSQAMKAAWIEDVLSLLPPAAFLIASHVRARPASVKFPWGLHRSVSIAYLFAALALFVMGGYLLFDSALKLVMAEHPPIGVIPLFGAEVWLGWS